MHLQRGLTAGVCWGTAGLIAAAVGIGAITFDFRESLQDNFAWWLRHAFPGIVMVPILLLFTGVVTYTPTRHVGFAKNLALLTFTWLSTVPFYGAMLYALGMLPPRSKSATIETPPMYISAVLMFLFFIPLAVVSILLIKSRSVPLSESESKTGVSLSTQADTAEQTDEPEPE